MISRAKYIVNALGEGTTFESTSDGVWILDEGQGITNAAIEQNKTMHNKTRYRSQR